MLGLGLSIPRCAVRAGDALTREVASILAKYGTDAHLYLPGIGVINGLTAGNYLDSAGTTAATVDNPVGLVLDAAGSVGSELVTNGTFDSDTAWTKGTGWTISGGAANFSNVSSTSLTQTIPSIASGKLVKIEFYLTTTSGSGVSVGLNIGGGIDNFGTFSGIGIKTAYVTTTAARTGLQFTGLAGAVFSIDNISVKEVTGIHATQATTANKPILRRGAVNLLTYSEQFDNAAWSKSNATVTANATTAPDGTSTMDKLVETAVSGVHYTRQSYAVTAATAYTFTQSVYVKAGERNVNLGFTSASPYVNSGAFNPTTGAWVTANNQGGVGFAFVSRSATLTGDIWRVSLTISISTASTQTGIFTQVNLYNGSSDVYLGDGTSGAFIWGAMLNTGSVATDYIPTTTAAASSSTGNYAWQFDGSNDSLALGSVPFQMADDHCVIAGLSVDTTTTAQGVLVGGTDNTAFIAAVAISTASGVSVQYRNAALTFFSTLLGTATLNEKMVVSARNLSGTVRGRKNAGSLSTPTSPTGTFTLTTAKLGQVTGAFNSFGGSMYPVILIKGTVTDADLLTLEKWVGSLSGVTI